jgi:hypothetical protein
MNTAQKARFLAGMILGGAITAGAYGMVLSVPVSGDTTLPVQASGLLGWFGFTMLCLAAELALAVITIWRAYHPLEEKPVVPEGYLPPGYYTYPPVNR